MNEFGKLLGEHVHELSVAKHDQSALKIRYRYDEILYIGTYADCCSETWFADIVGVDNIIKEKITGVSILELPDVDDDRSRQEHDEVYGVRLTTKKGHCDIIYRNSSNGYYSGQEVLMSEEDGEKLEWETITKDWQAGDISPN